MQKIYPLGFAYDALLEPVLRPAKRIISHFVYKYRLTPALDLCCGTGVQVGLISNKRGQAVGLDLDGKMMRFAAKKHPGIPFVCADAASTPFQDGYFKGIIISYALHDKPPAFRRNMISEAKRLLQPQGRLVILDFEPAWNRRSRIGSVFTYLIERLAGGEHFANGRQFIHQGGLRQFLFDHALEEVDSHAIEFGNSRIVVARFR